MKTIIERWRYERIPYSGTDPFRFRRVPNWDAAKGQFVPAMEANVTLSFDHRVLDGGAAGRLLARVAQLLASPEKL